MDDGHEYDPSRIWDWDVDQWNIWNPQLPFPEDDRSSKPWTGGNPLAPSEPILRLIADLRAVDATPSHREIDWRGLIIFLTVFSSAIALLIFCAYEAIWHVLVQFLTAHPVITDNAIGAVITITGLAVIRHPHSRPREK